MPRRQPGQGALRERNGRWISQTRDPLTGRVVSRSHPPGTTPRQAETLHREWMTDVHRRRLTRTGVTVAEHLDDWLATRDDVAPSTRRRLRTDCDRIADRIGHLPVHDLHAGHIDMLMVDLRKTLAPGTVRITRSTLSAALTRAEAWGRLERNPMPLVAKVRARQADTMVVPTEHQLRQIVNGEPDLLWRSMLAVLAGSGMRVGECLPLRWSDVDLDAATIRVTRTVTLDEHGRKVVGDSTKTRRARKVVVGGDVVAVLRAWRAELADGGLWRIQADALVWESPYRPGKPYGAPALRERLQARVKAVGADPSIGLRHIRHAHASHLVAAGLPLTYVAARLGHSIAETSQRYGKHLPDDAAATAAVLRHLPSFNAAADGGS